MKKFLKYILSFLFVFTLISCAPNSNKNTTSTNSSTSTSSNSNSHNIEDPLGKKVSDTFHNQTYIVYENGAYNTKYEVAIYIHFFHRLPKNYLPKYRANEITENWTPENKLTIGGNEFFNAEGLLPEGKTYTECDIETTPGKRGVKRIVYSNDYKVYYTGNHYRSFEEIY